MNPQQITYFKNGVAIIILLFSIAILLATSESDIASANSMIVKAELLKDQEETSFTFTFSNGPFEFTSLPLIISLDIKHVDLNETYDFSGQSWVLIVEGADGSSTRRVLFRRGMDDILYADHGKYTLTGTTSLFECSGDVLDDACIPCNAMNKECEFTVRLAREGAPYPPEEVSLQASQWLSSETSSIELEVTAN